MKKTTLKNSSNLTKRLAKYGALSAAIAGIADANGQIVFTDVNPDFAGGNGTSYALDMDNDSVFDFGIIGSTAPAIGFYGALPSNSWVGSNPSFKYPFALDSGAVISSAQSIWYGGTSNVGTLNYTSCYNGIGGSNWCGVTDKFLGLRFQIAGNTHYGWAKLDVSLSGDSFTVKEYAYNSVPDESIIAGQTELSIDEFAINKVKIVSLNKSIALYNLPQNTDYTLFDISGKSVLNGSINDQTYVIEANGISNGIYVVELTDTYTKSVIRKKIVL
ncbi:T9SS type A sorting domain-containing protein [Lacinutrix himadriensis]|uniref:T9SS type A sorting domain-containing protein n=1 Tax=Lacinutrix himadriensis TaxID=641549 RepID=UPI0006E35C0C|nr:T9SS type A sorting domain-containing protein [Lacinutrix himadriensis]